MKNVWQDFFKGKPLDFFRGKKITQMGLGLLGRGVGDAKFLLECGAELLITDLKTERELASSLEKLKSYKLPAASYRLYLGGHRMEDFSGQGEWRPDFILKSAGVPLDSPYIAEARKNNIPIEMSTSLFAKLLPKGVNIVGVTGTRGKSTTTMMIYETLGRFVKRESGIENEGGKHKSEKNSSFSRFTIHDSQPRVFLGGNVRNTATLPLLKEVKSGDYVVMELDSWQLQGFGEAKISPNVAVFTTFMEDHLNYYGSAGLPQVAMEKYFEDKANIFKFQKTDDVLVVGEQITRSDLVIQGRTLYESFPKKAIVARAKDFPEDWKLNVIGEHNRVNAMCAILATRALKIKDEIIKDAIENFEPVTGRLQFLKEIRGVKIYNDNNATTPMATTVALESLKSDFNEKRDLILIAGGADKGLDLDPMIKAINKYCKKVFLLPGTGTERIKDKELKVEVEESKDLKEAVKGAFDFAKEGDVVLFSPGFASFGLFVNEYDRNDQFVKIISNLSE